MAAQCLAVAGRIVKHVRNVEKANNIVIGRLVRPNAGTGLELHPNPPCTTTTKAALRFRGGASEDASLAWAKVAAKLVRAASCLIFYLVLVKTGWRGDQALEVVTCVAVTAACLGIL